MTVEPALVSWVQRAACKGRPTAWWFPPRGDVFVAQVAKSICAGCPVKEECLDEALRLEVGGHCYGIRGGLSGDERSRMGRHRAAC